MVKSRECVNLQWEVVDTVMLWVMDPTQKIFAKVALPPRSPRDMWTEEWMSWDSTGECGLMWVADFGLKKRVVGGLDNSPQEGLMVSVFVGDRLEAHPVEMISTLQNHVFFVSVGRNRVHCVWEWYGSKCGLKSMLN